MIKRAPPTVISTAMQPVSDVPDLPTASQTHDNDDDGVSATSSSLMGAPVLNKNDSERVAQSPTSDSMHALTNSDNTAHDKPATPAATAPGPSQYMQRRLAEMAQKASEHDW